MTPTLVLSTPLSFSSLSRDFCRYMMAAILCVCLVGAGCATSDEFVSLLTAIEPAADGIVAIVCIADAPACVAATAAVATYKAAATAVTAAYHDWQNAEASQQPGKLGTLQAAVLVLQQDFRNLLESAHISNITRQNAIVAIGNAIGGEISQLVALVQQTKAAGGTVQAAILILHEQYGGGAEPTDTATAPAKATKRQTKLKPVLSAKHFKSDLKKRLALKTGDAQLDKVNAETAAKLQ